MGNIAFEITSNVRLNGSFFRDEVAKGHVSLRHFVLGCPVFYNGRVKDSLGCLSLYTSSSLRA